MADINWIQATIAVVAIYGAGLSTRTYLDNRKEKMRNIRVEFSNGFMFTSQDSSDVFLFITVSNIGGKAALIGVPRIILPNGKTLVFLSPQSDVRFPHKLEEGTNCKIWVEMKSLTRKIKTHGFSGKVKLFADVEDGAGKKYKSRKSWELDIEEWA